MEDIAKSKVCISQLPIYPYWYVKALNIDHTYNEFRSNFSHLRDRRFAHRVPNDDALNSVKQLIKCAHDNLKITLNYTLRGQMDVGQTACPEDKLYKLIKTWPHY